MAYEDNEVVRPQLTPEQIESARLDNELKALDLEEKRESAQKRKEAKQALVDQADRNHRDMEAGRKKDEALLRACNHMKGGRDFASMQKQGDDGGNYSVIKHKFSFGGWQVFCTRCPAVWKKGDTKETHPTGISYEEAMKFPTDNQPSGTVAWGTEQPALA